MGMHRKHYTDIGQKSKRAYFVNAQNCLDNGFNSVVDKPFVSFKFKL